MILSGFITWVGVGRLKIWMRELEENYWEGPEIAEIQNAEVSYSKSACCSVAWSKVLNSQHKCQNSISLVSPSWMQTTNWVPWLTSLLQFRGCSINHDSRDFRDLETSSSLWLPLMNIMVWKCLEKSPEPQVWSNLLCSDYYVWLHLWQMLWLCKSLALGWSV